MLLLQKGPLVLIPYHIPIKNPVSSGMSSTLLVGHPGRYFDISNFRIPSRNLLALLTQTDFAFLFLICAMGELLLTREEVSHLIPANQIWITDIPVLPAAPSPLGKQ